MVDPLLELRQEIARLRKDLEELQAQVGTLRPTEDGAIRVQAPDGQTPIVLRADEERAGIYFYDKAGRCRAKVEVTEKGGRLQILTEQEEPIVVLKGIDGHGQVSVAAPDGLARAAMRSTKHGGVVKVINANGRPLGFLFGSDKGGIIELNNQAHRPGVSFYAEDDGGMLRLHQGGGEVMASISAHDDSGMLTVFGTLGEQAVTLCASENGGHVLVCDPDGNVRSELT